MMDMQPFTVFRVTLAAFLTGIVAFCFIPARNVWPIIRIQVFQLGKRNHKTFLVRSSEYSIDKSLGSKGLKLQPQVDCGCFFP